MKINEAVILLGGMGTRLLPYTKTIPKEMLPIYDVPVIFKLVEEAYLSGIKKIIFVVTKHNKTLVQKFFQNDNYLNNFLKDKPDKQKLLEKVNEINKKMEYKFVYQTMKGTFGALYSAKNFIHNNNFVLMYGDDLFDEENLITKELIEKYNSDHKMYVTIIKKDYKDLPDVGVVKIKGDYLDNLLPKKEITYGYEMLGRMLLNKEIFKAKNNLYKHANDEYYLPYALLRFNNAVKVYEYKGNYFNIGDKLGYIKASIYYSLKDKERKKEMTDFIQKII